MLNKIILSIFILLMANSLHAGIFGDNSDSNTIQIQIDDTEDNIIINNIELSHNINIISSKSRFIYDLLDARVIVKNNSDNKYIIEYKFVWYDIGGFEFSKQISRWKKIIIDSKDTVAIRELARTSKIETYKLYIRRSK